MIRFYYPLAVTTLLSLGIQPVEVRVNEGDALERTIIVDVVPPTDELTSRTYLSNPPHHQTGQPLTFHGVANDAGNVPQPSRPAELVGTLSRVFGEMQSHPELIRSYLLPFC